MKAYPRISVGVLVYKYILRLMAGYIEIWPIYKILHTCILNPKHIDLYCIQYK